MQYLGCHLLKTPPPVSGGLSFWVMGAGSLGSVCPVREEGDNCSAGDVTLLTTYSSSRLWKARGLKQLQNGCYFSFLLKSL